jgi:hypothetical protein
MFTYHLGPDGYEIEEIADDYKKMSKIDFPEINWQSLTLGQLLAPAYNRHC